MIDADQWRIEMARCLRETAELVERDLVQVTKVDVDYGHRDIGYGFTMRRIETGERTVVITLQGYDFAVWNQAQPDRQTELPARPLLITNE